MLSKVNSSTRFQAGSALHKSLNLALESREKRVIKRKLPDAIPVGSSANLVDFNSNDYLSLASSLKLRSLFLSKLCRAPEILGSGGSRLLVNGLPHSNLEARLANFFASPAALLFNSGFDANVGFFSTIPQENDCVVYDEYIHASVHDGIRASRARHANFSFSHNSLPDFARLLKILLHEQRGLKEGNSSLFVAVESLYSMDGTFAPLQEMVEIIEQTLPHGNGYLVVDEAHSTGIYGPQGRGRVALLGLENRVFARLHTFGKALAASGAVILSNTLVRDYLVNYARSLIYTTSLSSANIIAADCSFDLLEDGTTSELSANLLSLSSLFVHTLQTRIMTSKIPPSLLSLPSHLASGSSAIIPLLTPQPRLLSSHLLTRGINARAITWPTVPKGLDRVRICLHAGNTEEHIHRLVDGVIEWAENVSKEKRKEGQQRAFNGFLETKL